MSLYTQVACVFIKIIRKHVHNLLLKLFLAVSAFALLGRCSLCCSLYSMDLIGQCLSQLHFKKDGDQELFLACFTIEPSIAGHEVHDRIFVCRCGSAADTQVRTLWAVCGTKPCNLPNTSVAHSVGTLGRP